MRATIEGDDSALDTTLARADRKLLDFASKSRPAPKITPVVDVVQASRNVGQLERDIDRITRKALRISIGLNIPKNSAAEIKQIAEALPLLKNTTATVTLNRAGNLDAKELIRIERVVSALQDKSVTVTTNFQQTGTPSQTTPNAPGVGASGLRPSRPVSLGMVRPGMGAVSDGLRTAGFQEMMAGSIISSTITRPLIGATQAAIGESSEFEKKMRLVGGLTNIGVQNIEKYRAELLKLASDDSLNSKGPNELADAFFLAASKNKDGASALEALKAAAHGATAGLGEVKEVEGGVTSVLNAFNLSADQSNHLMDVFLNTVKQGGVGATQFVSALPKVASTAAAVGLSVEEMSASIATMTRVGIPAGNAATSLNRLLMSIIKPSDKAKAAIKDLGTSFGQVLSDLKSKGMQQVLADLFKRANGDITRLAPVLGPMNSIKAALTTQGSQPEEYARIVKSYKHIDGLTDHAAENATRGFAVQLEGLHTAISVAAIELGDRLAPKLAPVVHLLRDVLPSAVTATIEAWDSADPAMKKVAAGFIGLLALSGPILIASGTVKVLAATLLGPLLGAISTIAGAVTGAEGAGLIAGVTLGGMASVITLGLVATALAVAGVKMGEIYEKALQLKEAHDAAAASTKAMVEELARAAKVALSSPDAKKGIGELSGRLIAAGDDTRKLLQVLKDATKEKVEVAKDMKLSSLGKAVATREFEQFINNLKHRVIEIDVRLTGAANAATGQGTPVLPNSAPAAREAARQAAEEARRNSNLSWPERAKAAGITDAMPRKKGPDDLAFYSDTVDWQNKIIAAEQKKAAVQVAAHSVTAPLTKAQTQALHEQREAVEKLTDSQLKHERARLTQMANAGKLTRDNAGFDPDALTRAEKVENEFQRRETAAHQRRLNAQKEAQKAADAAHAAAVKAEEETAERLRAIETKALQARLQTWNAFGNAVEGVTKGLGTTGAEKSDTQKWAMEAQMARREFAEIPKPLRDIVVGLGAINDEMRAMTETRDQLRGIFGDLFKDSLRTGAGTSQIQQAAAFFEKNLDYANKMKALYGRGASGSATVINATEAMRGPLSSRIEQLQGAGAKSGSSFNADAYVDARDASARASGMGGAKSLFEKYNLQSTVDMTCADVASKTVVALGYHITKSVNARQLERNARAAGWMPVDPRTAPGGSLVFKNSSSARSGVHAMMGLGDGHLASSSGHRVSYFDATGRERAYAPPSGGLPAGSEVANRLSATPALPVAKARPYVAPGAPNYNGDLLQMGLPKGWGKRVSEMGMAPGETRNWTLKVQDMLSDTEKSKKAAQRLGMSLNEYAAAWRRIATAQDASGDVERATNEANKKIRELAKSAAMTRSGRGGDIAEFLFDANRGDYNRTPTAQRRGLLSGMVEGTLAGSVDATRQFQRAESDKAKVLAAGRPFLQGAATDMAAYERATRAAQMRVEAWNELKPQRDAIDALGKAARRAGLAGDVKGVLSFTEQMRALQRQHDAEFKAKAEGGVTTLDAEQLQKARTDIAGQMVAAREESELLDFEAGLIAKGMTNAADREKLVEMERVRREAFKKLAGAPEQTSDSQALADLAGANISRKAGRGLGDENNAFDTSAQIRARMLSSQMSIAGKYASNDPELSIQMRLAEERARLETENSTRSKDAQLDVEKRLSSYESQIRSEEALARLQRSKQSVTEAQNSVLDEQMRREEALAKTAQKRLEIELRYEQMKRDANPVKETAEEEAARREVDAQRKITAAVQDRTEKTRKAQEQAQSAIRDLMDGNTGGMMERMMNGAKDAIAERISKGIFRDPKPQASGMDILGQLAGARSGKTVMLPNGVTPYAASSEAPNLNGGLAGEIRSALMGGITAARVEINAPLANVRGNTVNVAEGGMGGQGLFNLPFGRRGKGGGSGTTPTTEQGIQGLMTA